MDLGGGLGFANEAPSGPKVAPTPRRMTYDDVSPMPLWSAGVDLEASIGGAGDDMGMGFGMADADAEPVPAALPATRDAPLPLKATAAPKKKSRFSKTDVTVEASSAAEKAMAMDVCARVPTSSPRVDGV